MKRSVVGLVFAAAVALFAYAGPAGAQYLPRVPVVKDPRLPIPRKPLPFTPASLAGIVLWLDALDPSTLTISSGKVSQWRDKSGAGNSVSQPSSAAQPTLASAGINGHATLTFNGTSTYLVSSGAAFTQSVYPAATLFIVQTGAAGSTLSTAVWSGASAAATTRFGFGSSGGAETFMYGGTAGNLAYPSSLDLTQPLLFSAGGSVLAHSGFIDSDGAQQATTSGDIVSDTSANPLAIGAAYQASGGIASAFHHGQIGEVVAYKRLLAKNEYQQVEGYLACKWGLQAQLPSSHPYAVYCPGEPSGAAAVVDVSTMHNDNLRTGWNPNESILNTSNVSSATFGPLFTMPIDAVAYAQPLYEHAVNVPGSGLHNLLIVATMNDTVYAFDADTGAQVWTTSFIGGSITPVPQSTFGCNNVPASSGILSSPVIDRATNTIYVVTETDDNLPTTNGHIQEHYNVRAIALNSGALLRSSPDAAGSAVDSGGVTRTFNAHVQMQRPALLEANGKIYISFCGWCDFNADQTRGWIMSFDPATLQKNGQFVTTIGASVPGQTYYLGTAWMAGSGLGSDASGAIYGATGNGAFDGVKSFGMSVLRLPADLSYNGFQFFTGSNQASETQSDTDLGSGGVLLLPDQPGAHPHMLVVEGKDGTATLLDRDALGGYNPGNDRYLAQFNGGNGGLWGVNATWVDPNGVTFVFQTGGGGPLRALQVVNGQSGTSFAVTSQSSAGFSALNGGGSIPSVTSNGLTAGTGIVWIIKRPVNVNTDSFILYAYDATNLAHQLYSNAYGTWPASGNQAGPYLVPTIANGHVYAAAKDHISAFGLLHPSGGQVQRVHFAGVQAVASAPVPQSVSAKPRSPAVAYGPHVVYGIVRKISGNTISVQTRSGRIVPIDITEAAAAKRIGVMYVNRPVSIHGAFDARGGYHANNVETFYTLRSFWPADQ